MKNENEPRNYSINCVIASSHLFLLSYPKYATLVVRQTRQSCLHYHGLRPLSLLPFRPVPPGLRTFFPFGCPETERKHRRGIPSGIDGEHIREDVAVLRGSLPDKPRPDAFASTSKRQVSLLRSYLPSPPDWIAIIDPWKIPTAYSTVSRITFVLSVFFLVRTHLRLSVSAQLDNQECICFNPFRPSCACRHVFLAQTIYFSDTESIISRSSFFNE